MNNVQYVSYVLTNGVYIVMRYLICKMSFKKQVLINNSVIQEAHNKFPDFFRMGTFIDSTHMKL